MDVKQELEDVLIKEEKFDFKEHEIKQENDAYYLQQTCDNVKIKMNEMIYDGDLRCKLETDENGMHSDETNSGNHFNAGSSIGPVNDQARLLFKMNRTLFTEDQIDCLKEGTVSRRKHIKLEGI
ncbi:uncharacterized protein LOC130895730 isoform X2 [Diorhabda carinulata]|nr:uncharacterized protein LOC130895730 isoform X2 [Diorhabda carinulata]